MRYIYPFNGRTLKNTVSDVNLNTAYVNYMLIARHFILTSMNFHIFAKK